MGYTFPSGPRNLNSFAKRSGYQNYSAISAAHSPPAWNRGNEIFLLALCPVSNIRIMLRNYRTINART